MMWEMEGCGREKQRQTEDGSTKRTTAGVNRLEDSNEAVGDEVRGRLFGRSVGHYGEGWERL